MNINTCPYAVGNDSLKIHYLFMSTAEAKEMDKEIEARKGPVCGKPVHPGSCMCKEHVRHARGYNQRPSPYPEAGAPFTCVHSPDTYGSEKRWIIHDKHGFFCAEIENETDAKSTVDRWIEGGAERVTLEWEPPPEHAADSNRETYHIGLEGLNTRIAVNCGWHSDAAAARKSAHLREILLKDGYAAAQSFFGSGSL